VFGGVRSTTGAGSVFGFTGALTDATALPYLRARTLDVSRGRFLSADTVQPNAFGTQGWNRYSYAANAPTTLTDPSGHSVFGEYSTLTGRQIVAFSAVGASATCLAIPACSAAMTEASYGLTNGIVGGFSTVADKLNGVHLAEDADESLSNRDVHPELRHQEREVDEEAVRNDGDLYHEGERDIYVLRNADGTSSVVVIGPNRSKVTEMPQLSERELQKRIDEKRWVPSDER
jgi:RHS repeat-associated protein